MKRGILVAQELCVCLLLVVMMSVHLCCGYGTASKNHPPGELQDICENEEFTASCGPGTIVMMQEAEYGRLSLGRCIGLDYGELGCGEAVLDQADLMCSGRRNCSIRVPNPSFPNTACPKDLKPFLRASYACLPIETSPGQRCAVGLSAYGINVTSSRGFLSSVVATETRQGTTECPYRINAKEGQKINITVHDYGAREGDNTHTGRRGVCTNSVIISTDGSSSHGSGETVCTHPHRPWNRVYNSYYVTIRMLQNYVRVRPVIVEYDTIGCAVLTATQYTWVRQDTPTTGKVGCTTDQTSWRVRCEGNKWVGNTKRCNQAVSQEEVYYSWGIVSLPFGLSVAVVVIIASIIGILFLFIGLYALRWKRERRQAEGARVVTKPCGYYAGSVAKNCMVPRPKTLPNRYMKRELPVTPRPQAAPDNIPLESPTHYESENEYSYIADVPQRPQTSGHHQHHHYQHHQQQANETPKYFELDPEENKRLPQAMVLVNHRYVKPAVGGATGGGAGGGAGPSGSGTAAVHSSNNKKDGGHNYNSRSGRMVSAGGAGHGSASGGAAAPPVPPSARRVVVPLPPVRSVAGVVEPDVLSTTPTHAHIQQQVAQRR